MESTEKIILPSAEQVTQAQAWWVALSDLWKLAFNEVILRRSTQDMPDVQELFGIYHCQTLRLAGPTAPFPNMTIELEDLSGLKGLSNVSIVMVMFHKLTNVRDLFLSKQVTSLFLNNNQITSLEGIETLDNLKEFYFNVNKVSSLLPLTNLTNLHTIYCSNNAINSLAGIGKQHLPQLKNFICLPNDLLPESEVIRMEHEIGIRCKKG